MFLFCTRDSHFITEENHIYVLVNIGNTNVFNLNVFLQGIKNADEDELKMIATDPDDTHAYNVADFESLSRIVDDLTINLCNSVKGPGKISLVFLALSTVNIWERELYFG